MKRGQRSSAEQVVLTLRQIEVQAEHGKSISVACKEADVCEQSSRTSVYPDKSSTRSRRRRS